MDGAGVARLLLGDAEVRARAVRQPAPCAREWGLDVDGLQEVARILRQSNGVEADAARAALFAMLAAARQDAADRRG
jgi:hypothetical protein